MEEQEISGCQPLPLKEDPGPREATKTLSSLSEIFSSYFYQFVSGQLSDRRWQAKPLPVESFSFSTITTKFVKFEQISMEMSTMPCKS